MSDRSQPGMESSQLTLRSTVLQARKMWKYLKSKFLLLVLVGFIGLIAGYLYARFSVPTYKAKTTFVLSSDNKQSGLVGMASQLGLDLGGGGNDVFSGENIITLFQSELLLRRALFRPIPQTGEILVNRYTTVSKIEEGLRKTPRTHDVFPFPRLAEQMSPIQDSVFRQIYASILKYNLNVSKPDKKTSFYEVATTSTDEAFSLNFTRNLVDETTRFYIETKTQVSRHNLEMLRREADSLRRLLGGYIESTASATDETFNLNPGYQITRAPIQQGQVKSTVLTTAYGEVVRNLELAKISLERDTPLFQVVDQSASPLVALKHSKLIFGLVFGFVAVFLMIMYLVIKRILDSIQ